MESVEILSASCLRRARITVGWAPHSLGLATDSICSSDSSNTRFPTWLAALLHDVGLLRGALLNYLVLESDRSTPPPKYILCHPFCFLRRIVVPIRHASPKAFLPLPGRAFKGRSTPVFREARPVGKRILDAAAPLPWVMPPPLYARA